MARKAGKQKSLLEIVRQQRPVKYKKLSWDESMKPADKQELDSLRRAYLKGELPDYTTIDLFEAAVAKLKLTVGLSAFREYLNRGRA